MAVLNSKFGNVMERFVDSIVLKGFLKGTTVFLLGLVVNLLQYFVLSMTSYFTGDKNKGKCKKNNSIIVFFSFLPIVYMF